MLSRWKLGQLNPGCTVEFRRISWADSKRLNDLPNKWLSAVKSFVEKTDAEHIPLSPYFVELADKPQTPILQTTGNEEFLVVFRQVWFLSPPVLNYHIFHLIKGWRFRDPRRVREDAAGSQSTGSYTCLSISNRGNKDPRVLQPLSLRSLNPCGCLVLYFITELITPSSVTLIRTLSLKMTLWPSYPQHTHHFRDLWLEWNFQAVKSRFQLSLTIRGTVKPWFATCEQRGRRQCTCRVTLTILQKIMALLAVPKRC
jgi:hypothetical protein